MSELGPHPSDAFPKARYRRIGTDEGTQVCLDTAHAAAVVSVSAEGTEKQEVALVKKLAKALRACDPEALSSTDGWWPPATPIASSPGAETGAAALLCSGLLGQRVS